MLELKKWLFDTEPLHLKNVSLKLCGLSPTFRPLDVLDLEVDIRFSFAT